ncbi:MAG TPA: HAD family phosphatase [Candidatus Eisenbacteria bacterium]|jgi:putative hydrolase of the HAD superfamily|nr:HAD family phosphatase [Candidatus Eisenbacteria bacterium]
MSRPPLRAVIFDIGRVLVKLDVARAVAGLSQHISFGPEELWSAIQTDPRWNDWQEGRIAPHDWHLHITKRLGSPLKFAEFRDAWNRSLDPQPLQSDALFATLARTKRLALLSNTDPIHVAHLEATYGFFQYFPTPARVYSCSVGASKPSPVVFQAALKAVKSKAAEAVFIDDIPAYVEAARSLGLQGIHYQDPVQLRSELRSLDPALEI